jgi:hypothetical protein
MKLWLTLGLLLSVSTTHAAPKAIPLKPEQVIQIKLRDLLGMLPAKGTAPAEIAEILQRLKAIEEQLQAIRELLKNPLPLPPVTPAPPGALKGPQ